MRRLGRQVETVCFDICGFWRGQRVRGGCRGAVVRTLGLGSCGLVFAGHWGGSRGMGALQCINGPFEAPRAFQQLVIHLVPTQLVVDTIFVVEFLLYSNSKARRLLSSVLAPFVAMPKMLRS